MSAVETAVFNHTESAPYREVITGVFYDKDDKRHEYAYTAIGFAHERVDAMLNPGRQVRARRFE